MCESCSRPTLGSRDPPYVVLFYTFDHYFHLKTTDNKHVFVEEKMYLKIHACNLFLSLWCSQLNQI
jgi:hypothetical protein